MKKIYIVLTHTGTFLSKIIKTYTKDEFSHVSISLDISLNEIYSFGRLNPYNPFIGGFVCEHIDSGTFKRFYKTIARVYSINITDEQYAKVKETIYKIKRERKKYNFNTLGLFAVAFNKKIKKDKCFYCAEFVKYIMEVAEINKELPELIKPEDFKNLQIAEEIYNGLLKEYN